MGSDKRYAHDLFLTLSRSETGGSAEPGRCGHPGLGRGTGVVGRRRVWASGGILKSAQCACEAGALPTKFSSLARPCAPNSPFAFTSLTGHHSRDGRRADPIGPVLERFLEWSGLEVRMRLCSSLTTRPSTSGSCADGARLRASLARSGCGHAWFGRLSCPVRSCIQARNHRLVLWNRDSPQAPRAGDARRDGRYCSASWASWPRRASPEDLQSSAVIPSRRPATPPSSPSCRSAPGVYHFVVSGMRSTSGRPRPLRSRVGATTRAGLKVQRMVSLAAGCALFHCLRAGGACAGAATSQLYWHRHTAQRRAG